MEKIKQFLTENGYKLYELDNIIEGNDGFLQIMVIKNDEYKYELRIAIREYFDRWANSGDSWIYNTEEEVLKHLKNRVGILTDAIQEYTHDIVELCVDYKYNLELEKFIKSLEMTMDSIIDKYDNENL